MGAKTVPAVEAASTGERTTQHHSSEQELRKRLLYALYDEKGILTAYTAAPLNADVMRQFWNRWSNDSRQIKSVVCSLSPRDFDLLCNATEEAIRVGATNKKGKLGPADRTSLSELKPVWEVPE
jgi:hypothetical protein